MPRIKAGSFISPQTVLARFALGLLLLGMAWYWNPQTKDDQTLRYVLVVVGILSLGSALAAPKAATAIRYAWNPFNTVANLVESWRPGTLRLESEYEKSLCGFLRKKLPSEKIIRQYGAGRIKCDISTGGKVIIELKTNFNSTQKLQRLLGQVELFKKEWDKPVLIVLIGETQDDLLKDLHSALRRHDNVELITKEAEHVQEESS
ncbi:MAG: hypothetical protein ACE5HL_10870 [Terriglobia bacterium]